MPDLNISAMKDLYNRIADPYRFSYDQLIQYRTLSTSLSSIEKIERNMTLVQ